MCPALKAEDVPGVEELERDAAAYLPRLVHVRRHEELHERVHVALLVERLEELLPLLAAALVDVLEVALLQEAGVAQHNVAEVGGRLAREDAPPEALPHELRQVPGVVYVGVREDHVVDLGGIDREVPVLLEGLLAVALVESAVEQYALPVRLDEVHGARGRLRRAVECYSHGICIIPYSAATRAHDASRAEITTGARRGLRP